MMGFHGNRQTEKDISGHNERNFGRTMMFIVAVLCLACITAVFLLDPFYHYHKPWFGLKAVLNEKEYQVPGTLRHFDYDMVLLGSSTAENNDNHWYDEAFGGKTVKAVRSYGGIADLSWYLDLAFDSREVRRVFFSVDAFALTQKAETTFAASGCPMYLYDGNPFNDIEYLLNKEVLLEKIPYELAQSLSDSYDEGKSYNWAEGKNFSEEGVLSHYYRLRDSQPMSEAEAYDKELNDNIGLITKVIEEHPQTRFVFFYPPYSMIWWDDAMRHGMSDVYLHCEEKFVEALISYDNVEFYDFQNMTSITTDLDHYMDTIHFDPSVNYFMCNAISQEERKCSENHEDQGTDNSGYRVTDSNLGKTFECTKKLAEYYQENEIRKLEEEERFVYDD